jgi:hypothetical protein
MRGVEVVNGLGTDDDDAVQRSDLCKGYTGKFMCACVHIIPSMPHLVKVGGRSRRWSWMRARCSSRGTYGA